MGDLGEVYSSCEFAEILLKFGVTLDFGFKLCMQREVDESMNFFASLWHPQAHSSVLRQPNIRRGEKMGFRFTGSRHVLHRIYKSIYSCNVFTYAQSFYKIYLISNHESYDSPRQRFIFVLIHLIYIFAHSFPSYALTCKYGCLIGFFPAVLFD